MLANKPAGQAGQAIQARFILSQEFQANDQAEGILRAEASYGEVCDQAVV